MPAPYRPIKRQLKDLGERFPELQDPKGASVKAAKGIYEMLVRAGQPRGAYTQLKAVNTLLDLRPDLKPRPETKPPVAPGVAELAKRMGVADPTGAQARFIQRTRDTKDAAPSLLDPVLYSRRAGGQ